MTQYLIASIKAKKLLMRKINLYQTILLAAVFLLGCNDLWLDKEERIAEGAILQYFNGDGFRLVDNSHADIINTSIEKIYKNDSLILVKANPLQKGMDTLYYRIAYYEYGLSTQVNKISKDGFDSLTTNLKEIIEKFK